MNANYLLLQPMLVTDEVDVEDLLEEKVCTIIKNFFSFN